MVFYYHCFFFFFTNLISLEPLGDQAVFSLTRSGVHGGRSALVGAEHSRYPNAILRARQQICNRASENREIKLA